MKNCDNLPMMMLRRPCIAMTDEDKKLLKKQGYFEMKVPEDTEIVPFGYDCECCRVKKNDD